MKHVFILRGSSGCGKSTYAKHLKHEAGVVDGKSVVVCSADDHFMVKGPDDGELQYAFNPAKLPMAHAECMKLFLSALKSGIDVVIVDNTNINEWEYMNYVLAAQLAGYGVDIVEFRALSIERVSEWADRNVHQVSRSVAINMAVEMAMSPAPQIEGVTVFDAERERVRCQR